MISQSDIQIQIQIHKSRHHARAPPASRAQSRRWTTAVRWRRSTNTEYGEGDHEGGERLLKPQKGACQQELI